MERGRELHGYIISGKSLNPVPQEAHVAARTGRHKAQYIVATDALARIDASLPMHAHLALMKSTANAQADAASKSPRKSTKPK